MSETEQYCVPLQHLKSAEEASAMPWDLVHPERQWPLSPGRLSNLPPPLALYCIEAGGNANASRPSLSPIPTTSLARLRLEYRNDSAGLICRVGNSLAALSSTQAKLAIL